MRLSQEARDAGVRKVLASRQRKEELVEIRRRDTLLDENESLCNLGRVEKSNRILNSCGTNRSCRVSNFETSGSETLDTPAVEFLNNPNVDITHMRCDKFPVDIRADFNTSSCHITAIGCNDTVALRDCPVEIICDDNITAFGIDDGRFGFKGTTDTIYCNGVPVDDPEEYVNKTLPDECEVRTSLGQVNGTCTTINATAEVTIQQLPCALSCFSIVRDAYCACPLDYTGTYCDDLQNITCNAYLVTPLPHCVTNGDDNLLVYDRPCMVEDKLEGTTIEMNWNISCKFRSAAIRNITEDSNNFTYWLDTPDLKLSNKPNWTVTLEAFQFSSFIGPISLQNSVNLTYENLAGLKNVTFSLTPDAKHIVGGRVYVELGFQGNQTPPGFSGKVMRRFFFDDAKGGYDGGTGKSHLFKETLGTGEVAIIVIASIVAFAIIAGIIRCMYERWKEEKTADEEVGERQKVKKD